MAQAASDAAADSAQDRVSLRRSIVDALKDAYEDRQVLTAIGRSMQLREATAFLRSAVNSGGTSDLDRLERALEVVADPSTALFKSFAEYQQDFNVNTNLIEKLGFLSGKALSVEEQTLRGIESQTNAIASASGNQISALQNANAQQLGALDTQLNALLGIDNSVLSLGAAIAGFKAAEKAVTAVTSPTLASTQFQAGSFGAQLDSIFRNELGRGVRDGAVDYYGGQYQDGRSIADIAAEIAASQEAVRFRQTGVPKYAVGTNFHAGGWHSRRGDGNGSHRCRRVSSSDSQTRSIMDTSRLEAQLDEMNSRMRFLQEKVKTLARIASDQDVNGTPGTRQGAVVATQEVV